MRIGRGSQITNYVSIVSHSTHRAVRVAAALSGSDLPALNGVVVRQPIEIGQRCFIGPHSTIEAGTVLGHGTLVASHSRVRGRFPDFAVLAGSPATVVGDTREPDRAWLAAHPQLRDGYEAWLRSVAAEAKT